MTNKTGDIALNTANTFLDYGILGAIVVVLLLLCGLLLWTILKDKDNEKSMLNHLKKMEENQTKFTTLYESTQKQNEQVVGLLTEVIKVERSNTKDCYAKVDNRLVDIDFKLQNLLTYHKENRSA